MERQKAERQLAKVERKRWVMQVLSGLQIFLGPPYATWALLVGDLGSSRSVLATSVAAVGLLWSAAGCLGMYAVTARRVQV